MFVIHQKWVIIINYKTVLSNKIGQLLLYKNQITSPGIMIRFNLAPGRSQCPGEQKLILVQNYGELYFSSIVSP